MPNESITLKQALENFMAKHRHKSKLIQVNIIEKWPKIAGNTIASRTDRIWIKENTLHLVISSSVLKAELQFHTEKLVERINLELGFNHIKQITLH